MIAPLLLASLLSAGQMTGTMSPTSDLSQNRVKATGSTTARALKDVAADVFGNPGSTLYVNSSAGNAWSSGTAYALFDRATSAGTTYVALQAGTNHPPSTSPLYWSAIAAPSDSNTCMSWAYACKTILGAYDKLSSAGGTIYLKDGSYVGGEVANQGLWFINSDSPPAGFRKAKPTRFVGVGDTVHSQFSRPGRAQIIGGHGEGWAADRLKPGIFLATGSQNIVFERVEVNGATRAFVSGMSVAGLADPSDYAQLVDSVTPGGVTTFAAPWSAPSRDVAVDVNHSGVWSRKTVDTDYTLAADPSAATTVVFAVAPPAGDTVRLSRQSRGVVHMSPLNYAIDCSFVPPVHSTDNPAYGPTIDLGFAFWNYFIDSTIHAYSPTDNSLSLASNRHALLYASDAGLIFVQRGIGAGGGSIKSAAGGLVVEDFLVESDFRAAAPAVWYESTAASLAGLWGFIKNAYRADNGLGTYPDVQFDVDCPKCTVTGPSSVVGGADLSGGAEPLVATSQVNSRGPLYYNQSGVVDGFFAGGTRQHRRSFGPQAVRYQNLATSMTGTGITFTPNQPGPDGGSRATLATPNPGAGTVGILLPGVNYTPVVGDRAFVGMWVKAPNGTAVGADVNINLFFVGGTGLLQTHRDVRYPVHFGGAGTWFWIFSTAQVTAAQGVFGGLTVGVRIGENYPVYISEPVVFRVPAGDMTDDEFYELAYATMPWATTAPIGSKAMAGDLALTDGKVWMQGTVIQTGAGDPENAVTATPGSVFLRTDGGTGTALYAKESGTGNSGWRASRVASSTGQITLSTGSGTATVRSGAVCTCTDTTANASVKCAVSSTTLTATGTGSDVIAYACF